MYVCVYVCVCVCVCVCMYVCVKITTTPQLCGPWGLCVQKCGNYYNLIVYNAGKVSIDQFTLEGCFTGKKC